MLPDVAAGDGLYRAPCMPNDNWRRHIRWRELADPAAQGAWPQNRSDTWIRHTAG
jgi:hypothetical protein